MDRVSVAEAAHRLGVSQDAIYKRIKRGTIQWEKGADDKTYVWIEEQDASTDSPSSSTDHVYESSTDRSTDLLLDELKDRIRFLEAELDDRKEEARRKDSIIMALTQRVPELEAPSEPRESPVTSEEEPASTSTPPATQGWSQGHEDETYGTTPQEAEDSLRGRRRSWWRKFFGLE